MKIFKFLLFVLLWLELPYSAQTLDISQSLAPNTVEKYIYCVEENAKAFSADEVLRSNKLTKVTKTSLGYNSHNYWCKIQVKNNSKKPIKRVFSNPRAGMDYIDVTLYKENRIEHYSLGDLVDPKNRTYKSGLSNFELSLEPFEEATIVTRYNTVGVLDIAWNIASFEEFIAQEHDKTIFIYLFLGFILAMAAYKFFIYTYIKDQEYLIYTFMLVSIFLAMFALYGDMHLYLFDFVDPFLITLCNWVFVHLFLTLLWVYSIIFFNITKKSKFFYILWLVVSYNALITLIYAISYFEHSLLKITPLVSVIAFFESIFLMLFSLVMMHQKKPGSIYFFVGHFLYVLAVLNYVLMLNGKIESSFFNNYSPSIGLFIVVLLMSLALSRKFKYIKDENERVRKTLENTKQYIMIGTTISYISHQWKQPLSILGSQVTNIMFQILQEPNKKIETLKPIVQGIEKNIAHINATMNHIKGLFTTTNEKDNNFTLSRVIDSIVTNSLEQIEDKSVTITLEIDPSIELFGNQNLFAHALSNIIDNSLEQFDPTVKDKTVHIVANTTKKSLIIEIEDNAGGIKQENINDIFEPFETSKPFGTGIGLSFTKNIIESKFDGKIEVKNSKDGAIFSIIINGFKLANVKSQ